MLRRLSARVIRWLERRGVMEVESWPADRCVRCGAGDDLAPVLGPLCQTVEGPQHWRCSPSYVRQDAVAAARYFAELPGAAD